MGEQQLLERITIDPRVMVGKPVIRGTRLTVEYVLNLLAHGTTIAEVLDEYEGLTQDDVRACLLFAAQAKVDSISEGGTLADLKQKPADERARVTQALRDAGLLYEPSWELPPPVCPQERAYLAQKRSAGPPLSELILAEREDRV